MMGSMVANTANTASTEYFTIVATSLLDPKAEGGFVVQGHWPDLFCLDCDVPMVVVGRTDNLLLVSVCRTIEDTRLS